MPVILAIDPGLSGALAFYDEMHGSLNIIDMPTVQIERNGRTRREPSPGALVSMIRAREPVAAYVERVGPMPKEGVMGAFQFGRGYGQLEGILAALLIPTTFILPQTWKKVMDIRGGKDASIARARELLPSYTDYFLRKKDDGRAEAALIALYAIEQYRTPHITFGNSATPPGELK